MDFESEGTLKTEERQFGPGLRALAFFMSRKLELKVLGYYEARKKTVFSSSHATMEKDNSGQATVNLRGMAEQGGQSSKEWNVDKSRGNHDRERNGSPGINHINVVQPDLMRDRDNGKNSVLTSQSVTDTLNKVPKLHSSAFVSPKGTVEMNQHEFTTTLNSINAELEGFDSLEESSFSSTKANTHATKIPTSNAQSSEARDHQIKNC